MGTSIGRSTQNVWHTVMSVQSSKPHKVEHDCKMLYVFPVPNELAVSALDHYRKPVLWQIQSCKRSVTWVVREFMRMSHYCSFQVQFFFICFCFLCPCSQFHSLYEEWRLNWLWGAKAGRQAEGRSIKLVNHFLFSLRTAVDWWERPLCPPSQPASKFAASPFQCMTACCGGRRRKRA